MCYVCLSVMVFLRTQKHEIHQILCISAHFHLNIFPTQAFFRTHLSHVIWCFSIAASVHWLLFAVNEVFLFFTETSCLWYEKMMLGTNIIKFIKLHWQCGQILTKFLYKPLSLSYSLLTKKAPHCKKKSSNTTFVHLSFCKNKYCNNCCPLFNLSFKTHTIY